MLKDKTPIVVGFGEILWDRLPQGMRLGGAPANFAYHADAQGAEGIVVSCVGKDDLGKKLLERLDEMKIDRHYVVETSDYPTGTVTVKIDDAGTPFYVIHQPAAWDSIRLTQAMLELACRTDVVCFGTLAQRSEASRESLRQFLSATPRDCLRIFDVNLRQKFYNEEVIRNGLESADVLKLNDEELPVIVELLGMKTNADPAEALLKNFQLRLVALTKGEVGSELIADDYRSIQKSVPIEVVDAVGAGDAFTAVLAVGLWAGGDIEAIHAHASRVASYVCGCSGATPEMPQELRERFLR